MAISFPPVLKPFILFLLVYSLNCALIRKITTTICCHFEKVTMSIKVFTILDKFFYSRLQLDID